MSDSVQDVDGKPAEPADKKFVPGERQRLEAEEAGYKRTVATFERTPENLAKQKAASDKFAADRKKYREENESRSYSK